MSQNEQMGQWGLKLLVFGWFNVRRGSEFGGFR